MIDASAIRPFAASTALACVVGLGCSSSTDDTSSVDPNRSALNGTLVDFPTLAKIAGGRVSALGQFASTDAEGAFSLPLPENTPFAFWVSAPDHVTYVSQEMSLNGPFNQGATLLTSSALIPLLSGPLTELDNALGVLIVTAIPRGVCTDEGGTTLKVTSPSGSPKWAYADEKGTPNAAATAMARGQYAVIYNVPIGVTIAVEGQHPTCHQAPFPYVDQTTLPRAGAVTYTGGGFTARDTLNAQTATYVSIFLE